MNIKRGMDDGGDRGMDKITIEGVRRNDTNVGDARRHSKMRVKSVNLDKVQAGNGITLPTHWCRTAVAA